MNTEQERADFEAWAQNSFELHRHSAGEYSSNFTQTAWAAWQAGRAALQSQVKNDTTLFCDLKTDEEKSTFFLTGRGYETGVIAQAIQNDVAMAYHRCSEYRKELKALQSQDREDAERYRWIFDVDMGEQAMTAATLEACLALRSRVKKNADAAIDHARRVEGEAK